MQTHMTLQAIFLHKSLFADLALISSVVFVDFHVFLQSSRSRERLTADVTTRHLSPGVPYEMVAKPAFRIEPSVTQIAQETLLL